MHYSNDHGRDSTRAKTRANARAGQRREAVRAAETRRFLAANLDEPRPERRSIGFIVAFLAAAALGGASLPFSFGEMFPRAFTATAVIGFDPATASKQTIDEMTQRLKAPESLDGVITALNLSREPLVAVVPVVESGDVSGVQGRAMNAEIRRTLTGMMDFTPNTAAARLSVSITTPSPLLSVRIANAMASEGVSRTAATALTGEAGLASARKAMEDAEQAYADLAGGPDGEKLDEAARATARLESLDADISAREAALKSLKDESARVSSLKVADLAGSSTLAVPESAQLDAARQKYISAKLELDRLSVDLGARHPRLLAARSAVDDNQTRLQEAIRQLDANYKDRVTAAASALKAAKAERAKLAPVAESGKAGLDELNRLKAEAERLRTVYMEGLDASQTSEGAATPAHIVAQASVETISIDGPSPALVAAGGGILGLAAGLLWLYATARRDDDEEEADADVAHADEPVYEAPRPARRAPRTIAPASWHDPYGDDFEAERSAAYMRERAIYEDEWNAYTPHSPRWQDGREDYVYGDDGLWGPPDAENDDRPLADRLRLMLQRHAAMDEREAGRPSMDPRDAEVDEIRRRMAALRERVADYQTRRSVTRR